MITVHNKKYANIILLVNASAKTDKITKRNGIDQQMVVVFVVSLVQDTLLHWQLTDNNTQTGHQYIDHLQLMTQFMPKELFFTPELWFSHNSNCFHIPDHVCTQLLYRLIRTFSIQRTRTHTLKHTQSLFQGIMRHYVYLQQSSLPSSLRSFWFSVPAWHHVKSRCSRWSLVSARPPLMYHCYFQVS